MKLLIFNLPTDPNLIPDWLEQQIVGTSLAQLIAELSAVHGGITHQKLREITGSSHQNLLEVGLRALSEFQIQKLLQNPTALGELQEDAFVGGYPYWTRLAESSRASSLADLLLQARFLPHSLLDSPTDAGLTRRTAPELPSLTEPRPVQELPPNAVTDRMQPLETPAGAANKAPRGRRRGRLLVALAPAIIAATTLFLLLPADSTSTPWGFQRPDLLTAQMSEPELFSSLATASAEWFAQDRATLPALRQSLVEFSAGCSALIAAPLPQLNPEKRELLREKCRNWQRDADALRTQLEAPAPALAEVRKSSDALMTRLGNALRRQLKPQA
jgi:hypothetical protein